VVALRSREIKREKSHYLVLAIMSKTSALRALDSSKPQGKQVVRGELIHYIGGSKVGNRNAPTISLLHWPGRIASIPF